MFNCYFTIQIFASSGSTHTSDVRLFQMAAEVESLQPLWLGHIKDAAVKRQTVEWVSVFIFLPAGAY